MRRIDPNPELLNMVNLLNLQAGDVVLDAQSEPDLFLRFIHDRTGDWGRCIGMCLGKETAGQLDKQISKWGLRGIEMQLGSPLMGLEMTQNFCQATVMRSTHLVLNFERLVGELERVTKTGGKVLARHTQWNVVLPKATAKEEEMIAWLASKDVKDGKDFFHRFERLPQKGWREVRYDVYTVASRDPRASVRHDYDWRTMLRDILTRARVFTPREILDLIERFENTRGAKVSVERYLALGTKR